MITKRPTLIGLVGAVALLTFWGPALVQVAPGNVRQIIIRNSSDPDNYPRITTTSPLPSGTENVSYSTTIQTAAGVGKQPFTFSVISGSLPTGLSLNSSTGAITGTPTVVAMSTFMIRVVDALGGHHAAAFSLTIDAASGLLTFYVSTTGHDTNNDCTEAQNISTPKLTLTGANGAFSCVGLGAGAGADEMVQVANGTYAETITSWPSGTSGNPFVLRSASALGATIRPNTTSTQIMRFNANHITVDGFVLDGVNVSANNVWFNNSVTGITFKNNEVKNIKLGDGTGPGSFQALYCDATSSGHLIQNNHIHDVAVGYSIHASHGIYWACANSTIEGNTIHDVSGFGMQVFSATASNLNNNVIRGNKIYSFGEGGSSTGIYVDNGTGNVVYNNVIYQPTFNAAAYGISIKVSNNNIYNNTVYNLAVGIDMLGASGSIARNNISYLNGGIDCGSNTCSNNVTANPSFANAAGGDFQLTASSTNCIDQGTTVSTVTTDFLGVSRPQGSAYDIGAYERQ